ncbi:MAG: hypothetical protein ACREXP_03795 [Steroidobacteraceae bacterium]
MLAAKREHERVRRDSDPAYRERSKNVSRAWRTAAKQNPEQWARIQDAAHVRYRETQPLRLVLAARSRAKQRGLDCDLTKEWLNSVWTGRCALTDIPFEMERKQHGPFSPSVDRIDNAQGYLQSNCRFILFGLNAAKGTGTDADVIRLAKAVVEKHA